MATNKDRRPDRVGPWIVYDEINAGGNAIVYEAARSATDEHIALKVIKSQKADREPYKRFAREAAFVSSLTIDDGALPLIDSNVPDNPTKENPAWLAMPIAEPIQEALADAPLEIVIDAIATIAETLARLAGREVAHRDIKPGNLYRLDGRWLVGDFGLIDIPDLEQLTLQGRPLGPAHFTAYELIANPDSTDDARPADVFSLGKTLWVLATEQRWPPDGHQDSNAYGFRIADMRPHPHATQLDNLIDSMTQTRPELRPTMSQVARDLRSWLHMNSEQPSLNLDDIRTRIRERLRPRLDEQSIRDHRIRQAEALRTSILNLLDPLNREIVSIQPNATIDDRYDNQGDGLLRSLPTLNSIPVIFDWYTTSWLEDEPGQYSLQLKFGCGIELDYNGNINIHTVIICGHKKLAGDTFLWQGDVRSAPVGSIEAEQEIRTAIEDLSVHFPDALEFFYNHLSSAE